MDQRLIERFNGEISEKGKLLDAVLASSIFLLAIWICFLSDEFLGFQWKSLGLWPRSVEGLRGILTMHFLHADWDHVIHNTLAIAVLHSFLFYFYRKIAISVWLWVAVAGAAIVWVFGRESNHIGASLVLYGEFAFLFFSGLFRRESMPIRVALVVALYYGSLIWYIFPVDERISYEGHFGGFLVGAVLAYTLRHKGPQKKVYRFEVEPEPDERNPYWLTSEQRAKWEKEHPEWVEPADKPEEKQAETTVTIRYSYKEKGTKE
jgi:membrane associated rhomboid family serine protease